MLEEVEWLQMKSFIYDREWHLRNLKNMVTIQLEIPRWKWEIAEESNPG